MNVHSPYASTDATTQWGVFSAPVLKATSSRLISEIVQVSCKSNYGHVQTVFVLLNMPGYTFGYQFCIIELQISIGEIIFLLSVRSLIPLDAWLSSLLYVTWISYITRKGKVYKCHILLFIRFRPWRMLDGKAHLSTTMCQSSWRLQLRMSSWLYPQQG